MGYCVNMNLDNVEIPVSKEKEAVSILKKLNEKWLKTSDWCRFDSHMDSLIEIVEEIGFSCSSNDTHFVIEDFEREKLGDHEAMFIALAPVLEDCTVKIYGEDDTDWKIVIKDSKAEKIYREDF